MGEVKIMADSTCDLSEELIFQHDITIIPLFIILGENSYADKEELSPEEIFQWADANKTTPKTSAVSPVRVAEALKQAVEEEKRDVVFLGISEAMSSTCNVVRMVAEEQGYTGVHVVDSMSLSTGIGLQVLKAARLAESGRSAEEIKQILEEKRGDVRASFVIDTLTYLARGGRCSQVTALLANTLRLKPCIQVKDGSMGVGKKYRGSLNHALMHYVSDLNEELMQAEPEIVFITHSGCSPDTVEHVRKYLQSLEHFNRIVETRAGGVISSHCGPGTLGVLYYM